MNNKPKKLFETINIFKIWPIIFWLMIFILSISYGFKYRVSDTLVPYYFGVASVIFILLGFAMASLILWPKITPSYLEKFETISLLKLAIALTLATIVSGFYFYSGPAYLPAILLIVLTILVTGAYVIFQRFKEALWTLMIIGICLFIYLALLTPLDVNAANMLPIIGAGCNSLLQGENPFLKVYPEIATAPLYYLPLSVLPYCPLEWLGIDLRWLNVALFLVLIIFLIKTFDFIKKPEILGLTFLPLLISPMVLQAGQYGHLWIYWFGLVIMSALLWKGRLWLVTILIGLLLLTRQTFVFIAGLLGSSLIAALGWKSCLKYGAVALSIVLVGFLLTYLLTDVFPLEFYYAIKTASDVTHKETSNPLDQISLSGLIVMLHMRPILMEIQLLSAIFLSIVLIAFSGSWSVSVRITLIGLCYILVISLSVFIHRYFYIPGLLLMAFGFAMMLQQHVQSESD
jgi:hypothetical protein